MRSLCLLRRKSRNEPFAHNWVRFRGFFVLNPQVHGYDVKPLHPHSDSAHSRHDSDTQHLRANKPGRCATGWHIKLRGFGTYALEIRTSNDHSTNRCDELGVRPNWVSQSPKSITSMSLVTTIRVRRASCDIT